MTTHWSVVLTAGQKDGPLAQEALAGLCQSYWYPLYAYVRGRGYSVHDAQDLTQGFFARLLERNWVVNADQQKGRFRSFLLTTLNFFLSDEWDKRRAQKRGGGVQTLPLQMDTAETRYGMEPADSVTPEKIYERRWALTVLEKVLGQLQREYERDGRKELFDALSTCLVGERASQPYDQLARSLGMTESAVKSTVHRLRRRYRQLLRDEITHTLASPELVDEELRHLQMAVSGG